MNVFRKLRGRDTNSRPNSPGHDTPALGLKVVADGENPQVDIVFVHGLTGRRDRTWTATGETEPWTKSLLPRDLPAARILTYGYDADVVHMTRVAGQNTVREHARNMVNELAATRSMSGALERPIIFVAHSLGGLVCQDALLICNNPNEKAQNDILSSTCGIAFLGTPHGGSDLEKFASAVANIISAVTLVKKPNKKILGVLNQNSEVLANIKDDFLTMVNRRVEERIRNPETGLMPIRLHAFIEELPVDFIGRRVVEPSSAKIPGYNSDTIPANHMEMTKFSTASNVGYKRILNRLRIWAGNDDVADDHLDLEDIETIVGVTLPASNCPESVKQLYDRPGIEVSLEWFLQSKEYQAWRRLLDGKLWLNGDPQDGKTVIMSYVVRTLRQTRVPDDQPIVASIFCSGKESEAALVTSVIVQLLQSHKSRNDGVRMVLPIPRFKSYKEQQNLDILWESLRLIIPDRAAVTVVIDGVDKLYPSVRSSFLDHFMALKEGSAGRYMRVIVSSTSDTDAHHFLSNFVQIDREKERRECLNTLVFQEWNARESRVEDAKEGGTWLLSHIAYREWSEGATSSALWLEGKPGSGKSTLTKLIVGRLESKGDKLISRQAGVSQANPEEGSNFWTFDNPEDRNTIIARFYYSFRGGNNETSHTLMLRSIVYQIWNANSKLFPLLRHTYRKLKLREADTAVPKLKSLWSYDKLKSALIYLHTVNFALNIVIAVDGMDESDNDKLTDVLQFLSNLSAQKSNCIIKVLIASRPANDINVRLNRVQHHIKLQEVNEEDIGLVLDGWIRRMESDYPTTLGTFLNIKDYIMEHSLGVFLWVTLVLRDLEKRIKNGGYSKADLQKRLASLPKELGGEDGFYRTMIKSLIKKGAEDEEQEERGRRILTWVTFSERPLSLAELQDALATPPQPDCPDLSTYPLDQYRPLQLEQGILTACGGLVEVRETPKGDFVQLIHQTAREFLLDSRRFAEPYDLNEARGDAEIAMACGRYIAIIFMAPQLQIEPDADFSQIRRVMEHLCNYRLLLYLLANFTTHLDHLGSNGIKIRREFEGFVANLAERTTSFASLVLLQWIETLIWPTKLHLNTNERRAKLCIQAALSLVIGSDELDTMEVIHALRTDALHLAAEDDLNSAVYLLLWYGVDVNKKDNNGNTALHLVAKTPVKSRHSRTASTLVNARADLEARDSNMKTPLHLAVESQQIAKVLLLLDNGADKEARDGDRRTALHLAVVNGLWSMVQPLLEKGADMDARDKDGRSVLHVAAMKGFDSIIQLLLNKEAYVESRDGSGKAPLHLAAENNFEDTVSLLLKGGTDVDTPDGDGNTALLVAAENGREDVVATLLYRNAEMDAKDRNGMTAMLWAAKKGFEGIIKDLQYHGADDEAEDANGRTPLLLAAENGHESIVALLLHGKADVAAKDKHGKSASDLAAENGHESIVQLLKSHVEGLA